MLPRISWRALQLAVLGICALIVAGCAGLPRIDPSGERIFLWPQNQIAASGPASVNAQAPPVFTAPVYPPPVLPPGQAVTGVLPPIPQDKLTISPGRVLAPVGSEVILKAGLCTRENFLLTDAKVEWLLARDEVGEFVELGGRGWLQNPLLPWNKPKKIDNQYAVGYTAKVPLQITRGTADPSDDVQVQPGEAWASITSPVEGTSRITAVAPEVATWSNRRATATIYWVDVQWTFPPSAVTAGGSQVLTTTVRRQTDGTPIEGWLVRYEVADGGGALRGSESGQVVEVATDAQGRASIDVNPTGSAGSTTRINTQVIRPERFANSNAPRLVIANGASTIQWTDGGTDYVPAPDDLGSPQPPTFGGGVLPPDEPTLATPPSRRGPILEIEVRTNDRQVLVGKQADFEVLIRNTGDSTATGIRLVDTYDKGLSHLKDPQRYLKIDRSIDDIAPGATFTAPMTFNVIGPGRLCQYFMVTYDGGGSAQKQACIEASQPLVQPQGRLEVRKTGPRQSTVGENAVLSLDIKNVGGVPLTNIEVVAEYDPALVPQPPAGAEFLNGSWFWRIPRLEVGGTWTREVNCRCVGQNPKACSVISVSAETGTSAGTLSQADRWCIDIQPLPQDVVPDSARSNEENVLPGVMPPATGGNPPNPNVASGLRMELYPNSKTVRTGANTTFRIVISNRTATPDQQVRMRVLFPAELTPDVTAIHNDKNVGAQFNRNTGELLFAPINEIRPGEFLEFVIPCNVNQPGVRAVSAEVFSQNMPQAIRKTEQIEIIR